MATMRFNQLINTGSGMFIDHQGSVINLLPQNVLPKSIENVEHYARLSERTDVIAMKFKNGHVALLEYEPDGEINEESLKEFQATCIMVHDI